MKKNKQKQIVTRDHQLKGEKATEHSQRVSMTTDNGQNLQTLFELCV